jgi:hypothetical protein
MSHWQKSKLNLTCSEQMLRRALINIVPAWEKYIQTDPNGGLTIVDMGGVVRTGINLKVPKNAPGSSYCDFGAERKGDGTWELTLDPIGMPKAFGKSPEGAIKAEVSAAKSRAANARAGNRMVSERREGNKIIQRYLVPA